MPKIWIDGSFHEKADAKVSVFDHGLLYGDGVFEGIRAYHGRIFRLRQHLERLYASAKAIWLQVPIPLAEMTRVCEESIRVNDLKDAYIRLLVTRGVGDLGLDPRKCATASVICIADRIALFKPEVYDRGLTMMTAATPVHHREGVSPRIKSLNYLAHILAKIEAIAAGADEALMLEAGSGVSEGVGENVFCVRGRTVVTPPAYAGILRGITRDAVLEIAAAAKYDIRESNLTRYELFTSDEMFLTGTAAEIVGVVKLDGRVIGDGKVGPVTRDLAERFKELVAREA